MRTILILALAATTVHPQDPAKKDDLTTIDGVIAALYDVISGPPGQRDWDRMRGLFCDGARLVPLRPARDGATAAPTMDVDGYIARSGAFIEKHGFFESELHRTTERFGHLAHAFSTYASRATADAKPFARGINSIQLVNDGARWRILTIAWEEERFAGPLPADYLPAATGTPKEGAEESGRIEDVLDGIRERRSVPALAAAVVRDGEIVAAAAVGVRKWGEDTPVTLRDRFHIGSDTKAMTAVLAGMLVDEGKLAWDSTIADVLPATAKRMREEYRGVTLEQLLRHRGGFCHHVPDGFDLLQLFSLEGDDIRAQRLSYVELVGGAPPAAKPGAETSYSNAGYVVVGAMLESVSGKSWEELIAQRLFRPLGITTAGFGAAGKPLEVTQPWPHLVRDGEHVAIPPSPNADNAPVIGPAGRVHLSIEDWARFVAMLMPAPDEKPRLLSRETLHRLLSAPEGRMAMGWGRLGADHELGPALVHSGSNTMNFAVAWLSPTERRAVVVATNQGGDEAHEACADAIRTLARRGRREKN